MLDPAEFMDGRVPHAEKSENGSGQRLHCLTGDKKLIIANEVATRFGVYRDNVSLMTGKKLRLDLMEPSGGSTKR
jgi:hypothetical protein